MERSRAPLSAKPLLLCSLEKKEFKESEEGAKERRRRAFKSLAFIQLSSSSSSASSFSFRQIWLAALVLSLAPKLDIFAKPLLSLPHALAHSLE